ncbi:MAG: leucine-rich repeat domain-containing protein [Clostridia bacterium]|nr:leucine-rich repeat domain-containing protein [Clostridia bacterium]
MKKIVSLIVILTLLITTLTAFALPASAAVYSGDCGVDGSDLRWSLDTNKGTLTISGSGAMQNFGFMDDAPWYSYSSQIESIELSAELTSIGNYAFYGCDKITAVQLPENLTFIGSSAFYSCDQLGEITIPEKVTYIGANAFGGCTALKKATFGNAEGWIIRESYSSVDKQSLSKEDLSNPSNAAFYLRDSYSGYAWTNESGENDGGDHIGSTVVLSIGDVIDAILGVILALGYIFWVIIFIIALIVLPFRVLFGFKVKEKKSKKEKARADLDAKRKKQMMVAGGVGLAGLAVGLIALLTKKKK